MKIKKQIFSVVILFLSIFSPLVISTSSRVLADAVPGCYKVNSGQPEKLSACPTTNVVYDDSRGGNPSGPNPAKCYVYSANLYDGDPSWGDPYVETPCSSLSSCPTGQELRYSNDKLGPPSCIDVATQTSGQFAGGATPPQTSDLRDQRITKDCTSADINASNCGIIKLMDTAFNLVSGGISLAIIGNIIYAGIQYSMAQGDPSKASKSKDRIRNAVIAFLMYVTLYAFIQWLIPGGVF